MHIFTHTYTYVQTEQTHVAMETEPTPVEIELSTVKADAWECEASTYEHTCKKEN